MFNIKTIIVVCFILPISLAGCSTHTKYHWGSYETLVHDMYIDPDSAHPDVQIEKLTADIQLAHSKGKPIPPGVHAHLGYMFSLSGNADKAKEELMIEKTLYPESEVFIDGLLQRAFGDK